MSVNAKVAVLAASVFALSSITSMACAETVIKIAAIAPLTGDFAAVGQSQLTGAQMRAKEINESQKDYKVEVIAYDDASNCDQSVNATVRAITRDNVAAILGATNSPCALAMIPITRKYKVPQFTFGVGTALTEQGSPWIFRTAVGAPGQTRALAEYAAKKLGHKKFAVLYADDEYGASMANGFKKALAGMGIELVAFESYPRADKDFTGQLTKIKSSGATALFPTGSYTASALIAKQMKQLGMDLQLLGDTGNATPKYAELGGDAVVGTIVVEPFTPTDADPTIQAFVNAYKAEFGRDPDGWVAETYDTISMILNAVQKNKKIDHEAIRQYVSGLTEQNPYNGILRGWHFSKKGDALFPLNKVRVTKDGKKEILAR
jgi:branched-chain amino acid transport system substrate-binding protein